MINDEYVQLAQMSVKLFRFYTSFIVRIVSILLFYWKRNSVVGNQAYFSVLTVTFCSIFKWTSVLMLLSSRFWLIHMNLNTSNYFSCICCLAVMRKWLASTKCSQVFRCCVPWTNIQKTWEILKSNTEFFLLFKERKEEGILQNS